MVYINEWLPNPAGPDGDNEFVELYNSGASPVNLAGWSLRTESGKRVLFTRKTVPPGGYLLLLHADTKLSLKNVGGGLSLYGPDGHIVDSGAFVGSAPAGKSFSRVDYGSAPIEHFAFTIPTPGTRNNMPNLAIASVEYPTHVPLNGGLHAGDVLGMLVGLIAALSFTILYVIKKNKIASDLFLSRDAGYW